MSTDTLLTHRVLHGQAKSVRKDLSAIDAAVKGAASLGPGAHGPAVTALQNELLRVGVYKGKATGHYDAATQEAVMKLQLAQSSPFDIISPLTATGIFDEREAQTLRAHEKFVKDGFADSAARLGQKGGDIKSVEAKLKALGFDPGKVDGVFDKATLKAVRAYRKAAHGVKNGDTINASVLKGTSRRIAETERDLKTLGFNHIGKPNGNFGKNTARAVRAFQHQHHLEVTGRANWKTRKALGKATKGQMYPHVGVKQFQNGYDVSSHQSRATVRALMNKKSTRFMAFKATEGTTYTNPDFKSEWRAAGKKLKPGKFDLRIAYHFLQPGNGRAQADKFLRAVGVHGKLKPGTRLALDWEAAALGSTASLRDAARRIKQVTGKWPLIYTSASQMGRAHAAVPHAPMWDAHYASNSALKGDFKRFPFVQNTSTPVDHDYFTGNEMALRRFAGW